MPDTLKVIEIILGLQLIKGGVEHASLFFNVAIAIVVILKADHDRYRLD